jgi:plastocyanin
MKYKGLIIVALIVLVAAGCNKKTSNDQQNNTNSVVNQSQDQQQDSSQDTQLEGTPEVNDTPDSNNSVDNTLEGDLHFSGEDDIGMPADQPEVFQIDITKDGFYPTSLRLRKGDYVQFVNKDTQKHWPASDPHPTHTALPAFDAKKSLATNEKFVFQFNTSGDWVFHDHMNPSSKGTITVQ